MKQASKGNLSQQENGQSMVAPATIIEYQNEIRNVSTARTNESLPGQFFPHNADDQTQPAELAAQPPWLSPFLEKGNHDDKKRMNISMISGRALNLSFPAHFSGLSGPNSDAITDVHDGGLRLRSSIWHWG